MSVIERALEDAKNKKLISDDGCIRSESLADGDVKTVKSILKSRAMHINGSPSMCVLKDDESTVAEEFKRLRTKLTENRKRLSVVSGVKGSQGCTTIALNLALVFRNNPVLFIDADLKNSSATKLLKYDGEVGLSDYLKGEISLQDILIKTGVTNFVVMPAGTEIIDSISERSFRSMLKLLMKDYKFQHIIVDTSSVVDCVDARIVGGCADAVILVARQGEVTEDDVSEAVQEFDTKTFVGVVFNESI
jgi:tyrosine-protein kinase Etk/Wzc